MDNHSHCHHRHRLPAFRPCEFPFRILEQPPQWRGCGLRLPAGRWNIETFYDPEPGKPGKSQAKWGGFIDDIDRFDPHFFGISRREAARMDLQQRLLLEVAWESLEDAGQPHEAVAGKPVGVFVGISSWDFSAGAGRAGTRRRAPLPLETCPEIRPVDDNITPALVQLVLDELKQLFQAHVQLAIAYAVRPYPSRITLLRPGESLDSLSGPLDGGWGRVATGVEVRLVPGKHHTMVAEPYVQKLAEEITRAIQQDATQPVGS